MVREDLDKIGVIETIHVYARRDDKIVVYFECDEKDVDFLNKIFREVNTIINVVPDEKNYLVYLSFPQLHYKKDLFVYPKNNESEYYRRLRMNEYEFITAAWLNEYKSLASYPGCHVPYLHPNNIPSD